MIEFFKDNSLMLLLGAGTMFTIGWLWRCRAELGLNMLRCVTVGILHTVLGLGAVMLFAAVESFDFSNFGSTSLFGGIFFMPAMYWRYAKIYRKNMLTVFDCFTPCIVFTVMCARVNCVLSGCCLGNYIPWSAAGVRFPTREIELIFYIALLYYFLSGKDRNKPKGSRYPIYMRTYGAFRFIIEGFRNSSSPSIIHISHFWAVLSFIIGISIYSELVTVRKTKKKNK